MKKAVIWALLAALLLLGCQTQSGAAETGSTDPASELDWVKECCFEYLKKNNLVDSEYGPKKASDLK